jgi:hypothetical protein
MIPARLDPRASRLRGNAPPAPPYDEPGTEVCTATKAAGAGTVEATFLVSVTVVCSVTLSMVVVSSYFVISVCSQSQPRHFWCLNATEKVSLYP